MFQWNPVVAATASRGAVQLSRPVVALKLTVPPPKRTKFLSSRVVKKLASTALMNARNFSNQGSWSSFGNGQFKRGDFIMNLRSSDHVDAR
jgi:hypothetical protein